MSDYTARLVSTGYGLGGTDEQSVWALHFLGLSHELTSPPARRAVLGVALLGASQPSDSLAAEQPGQLAQVAPLCSWKRKHQSGREGRGRLTMSIFPGPRV